jgi:hypothetical protein
MIPMVNKALPRDGLAAPRRPMLSALRVFAERCYGKVEQNTHQA